MKVYMETYGCSANQADGEMMLGLLNKNGFEIVKSYKESDINIINTCVVKTATSNRMIYRIKELAKTNKPLIVAGCMPKTQKNTIELFRRNIVRRIKQVYIKTKDINLLTNSYINV